MSTKKIKLLNLVFLLIFLFATLFINFFHTDKTVLSKDDCPACNFLHSTLATSQIHFFQLPQLYLLDTLKTFYSISYKKIFSINPTSRSPPQI
jgi:hypothetical protein